MFLGTVALLARVYNEQAFPSKFSLTIQVLFSRVHDCTNFKLRNKRPSFTMKVILLDLFFTIYCNDLS